MSDPFSIEHFDDAVAFRAGYKSGNVVENPHSIPHEMYDSMKMTNECVSAGIHVPQAITDGIVQARQASSFSAWDCGCRKKEAELRKIIKEG